MRRQYRHIVQEFGVAGFLCFYAFSPEKLFLLQMPSAKAEKHIKAESANRPKIRLNPYNARGCPKDKAQKSCSLNLAKKNE